MAQSEIGLIFPDEEIAEAAGVLEMISATDFLDFRYNARLKFQRYEESMLLEAARQEGRREGRQEGVIVGSVPAIRCR